jgi:hypothetical protein
MHTLSANSEPPAHLTTAQALRLFYDELIKSDIPTPTVDQIVLDAAQSLISQCGLTVPVAQS